MPAFVNDVKFVSTTAGLSDFGVGAAATGFQTPAAAGAISGTTYSYTARIGAEFESGSGHYDASNPAHPKILRTTILDTSDGNGVKVNFTSAPIVILSPLANDLAPGGLAINNPVSGGTVGDFLYVNGSGNLGQLGYAVGTLAEAGSYTIPAGVWQVYMNQPGNGNIAAGTIVLPATPSDGQVIFVSFNQGVDALTMDGGTNTVVSAPFPPNLVVPLNGGVFTCIYKASSTTWFIGGIFRLAIGDFLGGGTPNSILYVDSNQDLAEDNANFFYNPGTEFFVSAGSNRYLDIASGTLDMASDGTITLGASGSLVADYGFTTANVWTLKKAVSIPPVHIAALPTAPAGTFATVDDGDPALAWGATAVNSGAGATFYAVCYNGANWTVMAK